MNPHTVFTGRLYEWSILQDEYDKPSASLIVVYGRRRVGKTRLICEFYQDKHLWQFDGVEGLSKTKQITKILAQLSILAKDEIYASLLCSDWVELFKIMDKAFAQSPQKYHRTVLLDELPYMSHRQSEIVSALKWAWDNLWHDKSGFTLVLCGSIASFMVKKVVKSSALYGRIHLEICLKPLSLPEVSEFFKHKKSLREICQLYMFCGGIPEYLRQINPRYSVSQNIAKLAFCKDGYFITEFDRLFKDILFEERIYKKIIQVLAKYKNLKMPELAHILKVSVGGGFADRMEHLELAGFVKSITPWDKPLDSRLKRFCLDDEYLFFYFKFIQPHLHKIRENTDQQKALSYLIAKSHAIWAGFAFERLCIKHTPWIMRHLQIDQLVKDHGAYFDRHSNNKEGVQIDLLFVRHDPVITICEMKYHTGPVGKWVINEVEKKVALLGKQKKTIDKVLITTEGITQDLKDSGYFSRVVLLEELFDTK